jgi:essential nuclear protein 1
MGLLKTKRMSKMMKGGKKNVSHKNKAASIKAADKPKGKFGKKPVAGQKVRRGGIDREALKEKRAKIRQEDQKKALIEKKKQKKKEEEEEEGLDEYEVNEMEAKGAFYFPSEQFQINEEDDNILKHFNLELDDSKKKRRKNSFMGEIIFDKIEERFEEKKEQALQESILNNPKVRAVYEDIASLLKDYRSGKLPKAFKYIHLMDQWEKVLELTKPEEWSPHAMRVATKVFSSNLDIYRAQYFYENYLLPNCRKDIKKNHNLHVQHYMALKDAFYKPAAWFKGILFPLAQSKNCGIKEATIFASVLKKLSIPIIHSAAGMMILGDMDYSGAVCIFIKTLLEKRYALHARALNSLYAHFRRFEDSKEKMPVIWHQNLLLFVKLYSQEFDEMQRESIKQLLKKKTHPLITPEIVKALEFKSKEDIIQHNLNKSFAKGENGNVGGGMNLE